jgi:hypothetical protein
MIMKLKGSRALLAYRGNLYKTIFVLWMRRFGWKARVWVRPEKIFLTERTVMY